MSEVQPKHVHWSGDTKEENGGQEVEEVKQKSEELGQKVNEILEKLEKKRENDRLFVDHFRTQMEAITKRITDGFEKKLQNSYRDNEIQERLDSLQKLIGEIMTIEEYFRKMEESFGCVRQTIYKK